MNEPHQGPLPSPPRGLPDVSCTLADGVRAVHEYDHRHGLVMYQDRLIALLDRWPFGSLHAVGRDEALYRQVVWADLRKLWVEQQEPAKWAQRNF